MSVHYQISPAAPRAHLFAVALRVEKPDPAGQVFRLPAWLRGSYCIRDFAKHVVDIRAEQADGAACDLTQLDKSRYQAAPVAGALVLRYRVYAFDPSVRKAFLDTRRGFFNPSSLCFAVEGQTDTALEIDVQPPQDPACRDWALATSLQAVEVDARGFGRYRADDYEDLIDQPVEMGAFERVDFDVDGMPHSLVLAGHAPVDTARVTADLARICSVEHALFGHSLQLDRYLFLTHVMTRGYGGLEHRHSTALVCARDDLPAPGDTGMKPGYRAFLGLASHEYFHLWNVKRLTAARFAESDLSQEAYSRDLWHYEGVTSYYDDQFLLRAGLVPMEDYLDLLAAQATRVWRMPGRHLHSLEASSFETWTKYYQPDENTPNQTVSYYVKGALVALGLDLQLRLRGQSLDTVMRMAWSRYGAPGVPVPERGLEALALEVGGADLQPFFDQALRSTDELPLAAWLKPFGVAAVLRAALGSSDAGGRVPGTPPPSALGARLAPDSLRITQVRSDSPAEHADLAVGDVLVAVDGWQLTAGTAATVLSQLAPQRPVAVHRFRAGRLEAVTLVPAPPPLDSWTLIPDPDADDAALQRRRAWLGA